MKPKIHTQVKSEMQHVTLRAMQHETNTLMPGTIMGVTFANMGIKNQTVTLTKTRMEMFPVEVKKMEVEKETITL